MARQKGGFSGIWDTILIIWLIAVVLGLVAFIVLLFTGVVKVPQNQPATGKKH